MNDETRTITDASESFAEMTDGQLLLDIIRKRSWCERATAELSRRAAENPERDAS
jgi:hypothetical protein